MKAKETPLPTAQQSREASDAQQGAKQDRAYRQLLAQATEAIVAATEQGEYICQLPPVPSLAAMEAVASTLRSHGYTVTAAYNMNEGSVTTVSWYNPKEPKENRGQ